MEQFRTSVSLMFWTETPDQSAQVVAGVTSMVPILDQPATLSTVEYVATGRPVPSPSDQLPPAKDMR